MFFVAKRFINQLWGQYPVDGEGSVTRLIEQAKCGDSFAAEQLWGRYFDRAVRVANQKLSPQDRRVADGEDIALSAFNSLFQRARADKFHHLEDRDDLWQLLSQITRRKAINHHNAQVALKRGGGKVRGESIFAGDGTNADEAVDIAQFAGDEPTPEFIVEMAELCRQLLDKLPVDELRQIVLLRLQGHTNAEIAQQLGKGERAIERKLNLIRKTWTNQPTEV